ncbi:MAG TPA: DUF4395 domain-containing protein [Pseudonocardiaceae bacterium]|nr:DUF4395 domain-containing protein [Pseudonocardiaceae bacterium]
MTLSRSTPQPIDRRGPRFAAWVSVVVLAITLVTSSAWVLVGQALVFGIGAFAGLRWHPYGVLYRTLVAPRLGPPTEWEDPAPVRFAQGMGFVLATVGAVGYLSGFTTVGITATALTLGAAFLQAAFGICLGCAIYLRLPAGLRRGANVRSATNTVHNNVNTERGAAA